MKHRGLDRSGTSEQRHVGVGRFCPVGIVQMGEDSKADAGGFKGNRVLQRCKLSGIPFQLLGLRI